MIGNRKTRVALRTPLVNAINDGDVSLSLNQIAWENRTFDDTQDYYLSERIFAVDDADDTNETEGGSGIYELTLYVSKGIAGTETAEDICEEICDLYVTGNSYSSDDVKVTIDQARVEVTLEEDSYWYFPIRIDYRKFNN